MLVGKADYIWIYEWGTKLATDVHHSFTRIYSVISIQYAKRYPKQAKRNMKNIALWKLNKQHLRDIIITTSLWVTFAEDTQVDGT